MRRITVAFMSTISALVVLFSYHTSTNSHASTPVVATGADGTGSASSNGSAESSTGTASSASPSPSATASSSASKPASAGSTTTAAKTYTGDSADTRWGPVQVQITVQNGKITKAVAVDYPQGNSRDQEINSYALPVLSQEVTQAQSAQIDAVSGATVTSDGYIQSLQSAIDKANL
jgi:uncharacterized protein with FMN-binding domain